MKDKEAKIPDVKEFVARCRDFDERKKGDPLFKMYGVATFLLNQSWGDPAGMADGVSVFLVTWNWTFFNKFGRYNFDHLTQCLAANLDVLATYRARAIYDMTPADEPAAVRLFGAFLAALRSDTREAAGPESPIAAGKTLHILCPDFFPLWDRESALNYCADYAEHSAEKYVHFCRAARRILTALREEPAFARLCAETGKPPLKLFDEYNFSKFNKGWPVTY